MAWEAVILSVTPLFFIQSGNSICTRQMQSSGNFSVKYLLLILFSFLFHLIEEIKDWLACRTLGFDFRFMSVTSHFTCDIHQPRRESEPLSMTCGLSKLGASWGQVLNDGFIFCLRVTVSVGRPCSSRSLRQQKEQHIGLSLHWLLSTVIALCSPWLKIWVCKTLNSELVFYLTLLISTLIGKRLSPLIGMQYVQIRLSTGLAVSSIFR